MHAEDALLIWVFAEIVRLAVLRTDLLSNAFLNLTSAVYESYLASVVTHKKIKPIVLSNILVINSCSV